MVLNIQLDLFFFIQNMSLDGDELIMSHLRPLVHEGVFTIPITILEVRTGTISVQTASDEGSVYRLVHQWPIDL